MKDIYSPLEIDEEWDQRAPDMGDNNENAGTSVAVAPAPDTATNMETGSDVSASTLPPDQAADTTSDASAVPMAGETVEPTGDMMHDPAHDAAEAAVDGNPPVVSETEVPVQNASPDTLEINDMNSNSELSVDMPAADVAVDSGAEEVSADTNKPEEGESDVSAVADTTEPMKVNVMGDADKSDEPDNKVEAGETFNPETFPGGKMPEPETVEPEAKEEPELPASPVAEEEPEVEEPKPAASEPSEEDMDSTDKRFMAAIEEWNKAKQRANERLTGLLEDVEADIDKTRAEISDLEAHVDAKEKEREEIHSQLDELGEIEPAA